MSVHSRKSLRPFLLPLLFALVALGGCGGGPSMGFLWGYIDSVDGGVPDDLGDCVPEDLSDPVPEDLSDPIPDLSDPVPEDFSDPIPDLSDPIPDLSDPVPEDLSDPVPDLGPSCDDHEHNGDETGTDCGGPFCDPCVDGLHCAGDADCLSGHCEQGVCEPPRYCRDEVLDGDETDVDCGGSWCEGCDDGAGCSVASDCKSRVCYGGSCQAPSCGDQVMNGDETDVDCGGGCSPCPDGGSCIFDQDCQSGWCGPEDSLCAAPKEPAPKAPPACDCDSCKDIQTKGDKLPSPTKCKVKTDPECNGWTPAGKLDNDTDVSNSELNKATHFVKDFTTDCGTFTCTYLPRYNNPQGVGKKFMLHGLLCFSKNGCEACAYDLKKDPDDPESEKKFSDLWLQKSFALPKPADQTVNCSGCHRHGPILPKHQLWQDAKGALLPLNKLCIEKGGPKWLCHPGDGKWLAPKPADLIKKGDIRGTFDTTCHKGGCHSAGFLPKPVPPDDEYFCGILRAVFETGGSMNKAGYKFSKADCIDFMKKMGCDDTDLETWCSDKNIATQP